MKFAADADVLQTLEALCLRLVDRGVRSIWLDDDVFRRARRLFMAERLMFPVDPFAASDRFTCCGILARPRSAKR
jgi:hypothetical protein